MSEERLIRNFDVKMQEAKCRPGENVWSAVATLDADAGEVMPYLNAEFKAKFFDPERSAIVCEADGQRFSIQGCSLYLYGVENREDALKKVGNIVALVNGVWERRGEIEPRYDVPRPPSLMEVFRRLPGTNCGKCGHPTCMAFAAAVRGGEAEPDGCPEMAQEKRAELRDIAAS